MRRDDIVTLSGEQNLRDWLLQAVASRLRIDVNDLDADERLNRLGLDSAAVTDLIAALSEAVGRPLPPTLGWEHPSIAALARHLSGKPAKESVANPFPGRASKSEPIAIVGMSCRVPKANHIAAFWKLLCDGIDAVTEVPPGRWGMGNLADEDPDALGVKNTRWGGFLDQIDQFDAPFFGISSREAIQIDPHQRLALELCWEALEDAGIPVASMKDRSIGVFVGAMDSDYSRLATARQESITQHTATGQDSSIIAARVSYFLGLRGPSLTLNTACSSSLVAVHLACRSLREGESTMALAAGVKLMLRPDFGLAMSRAGALSPGGRSKAFDARADGYARGEGGGVVVLKRLSQAVADRDTIYSVIRGSAVNNDGFSNGLTAPNPAAQEAMLRDAYAQAGIDPHDVHYIEAHGTGTALGDPVEANALGNVLGHDRDDAHRLIIGSLKTNIGHLEAAAGIAGLIKLALSIQHHTIPPSLHFETPNPHIRFDAMKLRVPTTVEPWPENGSRAIAGISSFGFGGTNCHVVLEEWVPSKAELFAVSGDTRETLHDKLRALQSSAARGARKSSLAVLSEKTEENSSGGKRRFAVVVDTFDELTTKLESALASSEGLAQETHAVDHPPQLAFVFSGNGSQWSGMGRQLYHGEPEFRRTVEACDLALGSLARWSLIDTLTSDTSGSWLNDIETSQCVLFAVQVGLAKLWQSWGVVPSAVTGHSVGEIAAAHIAGALSLEDATRIVFHRSRLLSRLKGQGAMVVLPVPETQATEYLNEFNDRASIAAINSPLSTVVSGDREVIQQLIRTVGRDGHAARSVAVDVAYHSPQVRPLGDELAELLGDIKPQDARIPIISTVTGESIDGGMLNALYWARNLTQPVLFAPSIQRLSGNGISLFLEVSPHPILVQPMRETLTELQSDGEALSSLRRDEDERRSILETLGHCYVLRWNVSNRPAGKPSSAATKRQALSSCEPRDVAQLIPLSAQSPESLAQFVRDLRSSFGEQPEVSIEDFAYTTAVRRSHHDQRLTVVAENWESFFRQTDVALDSRRKIVNRRPRVAFVFPSAEIPWRAIGCDLLDQEPAFRRIMSSCDEQIHRLAGWSIIEQLENDCDTATQDIAFLEPIVFAIQVAFVELWRSWGIEPEIVLGCGFSEVAAAYTAGALSLDDGLRLCFHCGQLQRRLADQARLVDVAGSRDEAESRRHEVIGSLKFLSFENATCQWVSSATGQLVDAGNVDAGSWWDNLRQPVPFASAMNQVLELGCDAVVEVGSHPVLEDSIRKCLAAVDLDIPVLQSFQGDQRPRETMLASLGTLYSLGADVNWPALHRGMRSFVKLPSYPWQRKRFWPDPPRGGSVDEHQRRSSHPLLDRSVASIPSGWNVDLKAAQLRYLADHRVEGSVVLPAAVYIETALAVADEAFGTQAVAGVRDVTIPQALNLDASDGTAVRAALEHDAADNWCFTVSSHKEVEETGTVHARGVIDLEKIRAPSPIDPVAIKRRCLDSLTADDLYRMFAEVGLEYGPAFRKLQRIWLGNSEALAQIDASEEPSAYRLHPSILDACFQVLLAAADGIEYSSMPVAIGRVTLFEETLQPAYCHAVALTQDAAGIEGDIHLLDASGRVIVQIEKLRCQTLKAATRDRSCDDFWYRSNWQSGPAPFPECTTVVDTLRSRIDDWSGELRKIDDVHAFAHDIDVLTAAYIRRALRALGWNGALARLGKIREDLEIHPANDQFLQRLLAIVQNTGRPMPTSDPEPLFEQLWRDVPEYRTELTLLKRCGSELASILKTPSLALGVLFQDDTIRQWFESSTTYSFFLDVMAESIAEIFRQVPSDRVVRILEVGAGTGAFTSHLVKLLPPDRVEYVFTDISTSFFGRAKEKFADYPFIKYRTLNLEEDPRSQGFAACEFDLIVADDVVHATRDLSVSLENLKRLLTPGGWLALVEVTNCPQWMDLVFGCLDGWWRFTDFDRRPAHATMPRDKWSHVLAESGFDSVVSMSNRDDDEFVHSVFWARNPVAICSTATQEDDKWIILGPGENLHEPLSTQLNESGVETVLVAAGEHFAPLAEGHYECCFEKRQDVAQLMAEVPQVDRIVYLAGGGDSRSDLVSVLHVVQTLLAQRQTNVPRISIVTFAAQMNVTCPDQATVVGLVRTIRNEHPELLIDSIDVAADASPDELFDALQLNVGDTERVHRGEQWYVPRLVREHLPEKEIAALPSTEEAFRLEIDEPGSFDRLALRSSRRRSPGADEVEIKVTAAALNFIDLVAAMRMHPDPAFYDPMAEGFHPLGMECAGEVIAVGEDVANVHIGDQVLALGDYCLGSHVTTPACLVAPKPPGVSDVEAAATPAVFLTVHYALHHLAHLAAGERVLIHSAAGGVGLAAVQYAHAIGAHVFATAGTEEKRELLRSQGIQDVMDSRSSDWADQILEHTDGQGVDVVLNSLAGQAIPDGLRVLARYGRFLEIGVRDIFEDSKIGLHPFRNDLSFFAIDLHHLIRDRRDFVQEMLHEVLELFESGKLRPLPVTTFPMDRVDEAFRFMSRGTHVGKICVELASPRKLSIAPSRQLFHADGAYLISGAFGGFGLTLAEWMIARGARHLVMMGRRGPSSRRARRLIEQWRRRGIDVLTVNADVSQRPQVDRVLERVKRSMSVPLRGVFHLAMVLDDDFIERLDAERMENVLAPKVDGAWNLHASTEGIPLDYFVLFSSITHLLGNPQQASYVAANAYLDALARYRRDRDLSAMAIAWGVLSDIGRVARSKQLGKVQQARGLRTVSPSEALDALERMLREQPVECCFADVDWHLAANSWPHSTRVRHLCREENRESGVRENGNTATLQSQLISELADLLGTTVSAIDVEQPLTRFGLDSMMAFEFKNWIEANWDVTLSQVELLDGLSINHLVQRCSQ